MKETIRFKCPGCEHLFKTKASAAGKKATCNKCGTEFRVPAPRSETLASPSQLSSAPPATSELFDELTDLPAFQSTSPSSVGSNSPLDPFATPPSSQATSIPNLDNIDLGQALHDASSSIEQAVQQHHSHQAYLAGAKVTVEQIKQCVGPQINPIERTEGYAKSLKSVSIAMVLLPVAFVTMVIGGSLLLTWLAYGWFSADNQGGLLHPAVLFGFIGLAVILLAAWIPTVHMIFAGLSILFSGRREQPPGTKTISSKEQPVLHAFVDEICHRLGAPIPTRIDLDCAYNASASFDRGLLGMKDDEYVLTLGVPLIASQSAEQLASVIAHEFGHFCQKGGMRASFVIRNLNGWFFRAAYEKTIRDEVGAYIAQNSEMGAGVFWAMGYVINFLGRQMLWAFGFTGHNISSKLSREMEYDADRFAVHLAGTKAFSESMGAIGKHSVAHSVTIENLKMLFANGVLVDNIPRFMMHIAKTMPGSVVRKIQEQTEKEKEESFDTHPPIRERISAAKTLNQAGIVRVGRPASDLFKNWTDLCKAITLHFYSEVTDAEIKPSQVTPLEDILKAEHKLLLDKA